MTIFRFARPGTNSRWLHVTLNEIEEGGGIEPHYHAGVEFDHAYYVIEGEVIARVGDHEERIGPDSLMLFPCQEVHGFRVVSPGGAEDPSARGVRHRRGKRRERLPAREAPLAPAVAVGSAVQCYSVERDLSSGGRAVRKTRKVEHDGMPERPTGEVKHPRELAHPQRRRRGAEQLGRRPAGARAHARPGRRPARTAHRLGLAARPGDRTSSTSPPPSACRRTSRSRCA